MSSPSGWSPTRRDPSPRQVDWPGAFLSVIGLALLLWAIIEVPVHGWHSSLVVTAGAASLVVLAAFVVWERHTPHPLLLLEPFANRRFSVAMAAVALAVFSLMGYLFVLTQYLQFVLGYSPFQTGLRILPIAAVLAVASVVSTVLDRILGTKVVVAAGALIVAAGLWLATTTTPPPSTSATPWSGMSLLGLGAGMIMAPATASVMGSLPRKRAGVGSATNSSALQVGGALGVAVIGSVLAVRYQADMAGLLVGHNVPPVASSAILGSVGGALAVAHAGRRRPRCRAGRGGPPRLRVGHGPLAQGGSGGGRPQHRAGGGRPPVAGPHPGPRATSSNRRVPGRRGAAAPRARGTGSSGSLAATRGREVAQRGHRRPVAGGGPHPGQALEVAVVQFGAAVAGGAVDVDGPLAEGEAVRPGPGHDVGEGPAGRRVLQERHVQRGRVGPGGEKRVGPTRPSSSSGPAHQTSTSS